MALAALLTCTFTVHAWAEETPTDTPNGDEASSSKTSGAESSSDETDGDGDDGVDQELAEAQAIPEFDRIRTPPSPAFTILGLSPSEVQRPNTPRDFAITVVSTLESGAELTVPKDVAIEIAPYWMRDRKHSTFNDYMKSDWGANALRNFSVSVGSSSREVPELDDMGMETGDKLSESLLAVGARTQLFTGKSRAEVCGVKLQRRIAALVENMATDVKLFDPELEDKALRATAEAATWSEAVEYLEKRDDARKRIATYNAVLTDANADVASKQQAADKHNQATKDEKAAQQELDELLASQLERQRVIVGKLKPAEDELAKTKTKTNDAAKTKTNDAAKTKLQKQIEDWRKQLRRIAAALAVAKQAAERDMDADKARAKAVTAQGDADKAEKVHTDAIAAYEKSTYKNKMSEAIEICKDASAARLGWNLSVAGALAWRFPESKFSDGDLTNAAGWLTLAHSAKNGTSVAAIARLSWRQLDEALRATMDANDSEVFFDTGGRLIYAKSKFAVSGEGVARIDADEFVGIRAAIAAEYMVSKGKWLSISFGKDFSNDDDIFTLANLNWGVGGESRLQEPQ